MLFQHIPQITLRRRSICSASIWALSPVNSEAVEPQCSVTHTTSQACCTSASQNKTTLPSGTYWKGVTASVASLCTVGGGCHDDRMPVSHVKEAEWGEKKNGHVGGEGVGRGTASKRSGGFNV